MKTISVIYFLCFFSSLLDFSFYFIGKIIIYCCCISFIWLKMLICLFEWGFWLFEIDCNQSQLCNRSCNVFRCGLDFSHAGRLNQQLLSQSVSQLVRRTDGQTDEAHRRTIHHFTIEAQQFSFSCCCFFFILVLISFLFFTQSLSLSLR